MHTTSLKVNRFRSGWPGQQRRVRLHRRPYGWTGETILKSQIGRWVIGFILLFGLAASYMPAQAQVVVEVGHHHHHHHHHRHHHHHHDNH
jgi:hypothetical protein